MSATLQTPRTRPGLLPEARELVLPDGIVASGWPAVEAVCRKVGIFFDAWQQDLNRAILAKDAFGLYAADTVGMSIPRQVGKTYDVGGVIFGDSIVNPGTTTIWTAHRFKVAREAFDSLKAMATLPAMAAHIDPDAITTAAGNEVIPFRNGSRIVFAARERGAIRGFTKVRRLVLDEAQILSTTAMSDLAPTMNQAVNPQIIAMGTPPKPGDPSEWFTDLRATALAGTSEGTLWVEFGAAPGSKWDDRAAWRVANPSYPRRTPEAAILRLRKLLTLEDFLREALGIWDSSSVQTLLSFTTWKALGTSELIEDGVPSYGVKFAADGSTAALAVALKRTDEPTYVELLDHRSMSEGKQWLVDFLAAEWRNAAEIVIDGKSDSGDLKQALLEERVAKSAIRLVGVDQVITAHSMFHEAFKQRALLHFSPPVEGDDEVVDPLDRAVQVAAKRLIGTSGGWGWRSVLADEDVTPLEAVTLAHFGAMTTKRKPGRKAEVIW